jgi:hypothetical protein
MRFDAKQHSDWNAIDDVATCEGVAIASRVRVVPKPVCASRWTKDSLLAVSQWRANGLPREPALPGTGVIEKP